MTQRVPGGLLRCPALRLTGGGSLVTGMTGEPPLDYWPRVGVGSSRPSFSPVLGWVPICQRRVRVSESPLGVGVERAPFRSHTIAGAPLHPYPAGPRPRRRAARVGRRLAAPSPGYRLDGAGVSESSLGARQSGARGACTAPSLRPFWVISSRPCPSWRTWASSSYSSCWASGRATTTTPATTALGLTATRSLSKSWSLLLPIQSRFLGSCSRGRSRSLSRLSLAGSSERGTGKPPAPGSGGGCRTMPALTFREWRFWGGDCPAALARRGCTGRLRGVPRPGDSEVDAGHSQAIQL